MKSHFSVKTNFYDFWPLFHETSHFMYQWAQLSYWGLFSLVNYVGPQHYPPRWAPWRRGGLGGLAEWPPKHGPGL